jgi:hypothetical protein
MHKSKRPMLRWTAISLGLLAALVASLWFSLELRPAIYARTDSLPLERRQAKAKQFWAQSTQLRNDIANEPRWEAVFSDEEVNAWLSEDLVSYFAGQIPPGVSEPRVAFESGRVVMAFRYVNGPLHTYISVRAGVRVVEDNVVAVTIEDIRAGVLPVAANQIIDRITEHALAHGLNIKWQTEDEKRVAYLRYSTYKGRKDVVLEDIVLAPGQVRLRGRSDRSHGVVRAKLPKGRMLQSTFPVKRTDQQRPPSVGPMG